MSLKRFFGFDDPSQKPRDARPASDTDHDRELTETFEFVDSADKGRTVEPRPKPKETSKDRTEALAIEVLEAKADVNAAVSGRLSGAEHGFALEIALRHLAQKQVEQARHNLDQGKGTQGQLDQAIRELERAEETLERSEEGAEVLARHRADRAAGGEIDIGGYTAGQIRGRPRRGRTETSSSA